MISSIKTVFGFKKPTAPKKEGVTMIKLTKQGKLIGFVQERPDHNARLQARFKDVAKKIQENVVRDIFRNAVLLLKQAHASGLTQALNFDNVYKTKTGYQLSTVRAASFGNKDEDIKTDLKALGVFLRYLAEKTETELTKTSLESMTEEQAEDTLQVPFNESGQHRLRSDKLTDLVNRFQWNVYREDFASKISLDELLKHPFLTRKTAPSDKTGK